MRNDWGQQALQIAGNNSSICRYCHLNYCQNWFSGLILVQRWDLNWKGDWHTTCLAARCGVAERHGAAVKLVGKIPQNSLAQKGSPRLGRLSATPAMFLSSQSCRLLARNKEMEAGKAAPRDTLFRSDSGSGWTQIQFIPEIQKSHYINWIHVD